MPNVRISDYPPATLPLTGTEELEIVQGGQSRRVSVSNAQTTSNPTPLVVLADINTATPPTTELVTDLIQLRDLEGVDILAQFGFIASNQLRIQNQMRAGNLTLSVLDAGGVEQVLVTLNPVTQQVILPLSNDVVTPTLAFGDGDSGFFERADDDIAVSILGISRWHYSGNSFASFQTNGATLLNEIPNATNPVFTFDADLDTGIGRSAANQLSLIAGGVQVANLTEAAGVVQMIFPVQNNEANPSIAFGDGDTGFFATVDNQLTVSVSGTARWDFAGGSFQARIAGGPAILNEAASAINPSLVPNISDADSGMGRSAADQLSLIAGGVQVANLTELAGIVQLIVPLQNNAAAPSIAFGDGDTGIYESADDILTLATAGLSRFEIALTGNFQATVTSGPALRFLGPSPTNPSIVPDKSDTDTGIGQGVADQLSLIAGGVEALRFSESSLSVFQVPESRVGITADVGSAQGNGVIFSSYNVYSVVANVGDAATLPVSFVEGTLVYVKNDGANSMDVFPASGDTITPNAVNVAEAVVAGVGALFMATAANATWTRMVLN